MTVILVGRREGIRWNAINDAVFGRCRALDLEGKPICAVRLPVATMLFDDVLLPVSV